MLLALGMVGGALWSQAAPTGITVLTQLTDQTVKSEVPPENPVVNLARFVTEKKAGLLASTSDWGPKAVYAWTLTGGTLTSGQGSRAITFTAGVAGTILTAQVVVTAYGGSGSGSASATVVAAPNAELALPLKTHPGDSWMKASVPHQQGMTYLWSIVPGNGRASITAGQGTHVISFSAGPSAGAFHLKVDVQNQAGDAVASTRKVTIQTGTWLVKNGGASVTRYPCQSTRLPSGRVLVTGGGGNSAEVYDPETGHWNLVDSMANPRVWHTSTLLVTGQVLVAGNGTAELYDPASGTWHHTGKPGTSRRACTATLLLDGTVLAAGGDTATAEVYDPAAGKWTSTGSMEIARTFHTATRLLDGKVLVAGGSEDNPVTELYDPTNGTWGSAGSLNQARDACAATLLVDGKVLVTGGNKEGSGTCSAEIYDPGAGTWTLTATPTAMRWPERRHHTITLLPDGRVLMAGGAHRDDWLFSTAIYDPVASIWTPAGDLGTGRFGHAATLLQDGTVLVTGGRGSLYLYDIASSEIYDPANGAWKPLAGQPMAPREFHTATLLANGQALVTGGENFLRGILNNAEIAAPETGYWTPAKNMGTTRMGHTATLLSDGKVLVVGGNANSPPGLTSAELYDPAEGSWTLVGSLNETRGGHTATLLPNGKVLVVSESAELYDPATSTWLPTTSPAIARSGHTSTLLPTGKVLVVGGGSFSDPIANAELYDPAGETWTAVATLGTPRLGHMATLLPNGRVLVTGGTGVSGLLDSAEIFDPATNGWLPTSAMGSARRSHSADLLANGKVLVVGGWNSSNSTLGSAELYDPATQVWTPTDNLALPRAGHRSIRFPNGDVMVAFGPGGDLVTEIYRP
ncbi:Kelch repeat-containing protein [Geothrix campi]|jgi:uncharacterized delta-60 repeat protein|uniref:Kelch repeat-containing protein n=1 Tax=Geothrix campi TaxID=2966450 RepID=UPI0021477C10|nr:kelch repeat-containing protein [Geothrix sp. SG10]